MAEQAEVFAHIQNTLSELFELDSDDITLDAELYEGLDIDSIDAVDLIVELKKYTGKKIAPDEFKTVRTVNDLVNAVLNLMNND
jgi:acyl carrier protein